MLLLIVVAASSFPIRPPALLPDHTWSFAPEPETAVLATFTFAPLPVLPIKPPAQPFWAVMRMPYGDCDEFVSVLPVLCEPSSASPQSVVALSVNMVSPLTSVSPPLTLPMAPPAELAPVTSRVWADRFTPVSVRFPDVVPTRPPAAPPFPSAPTAEDSSTGIVS